MNVRPKWKWRRDAGHGGFVPRGWRLAWYEPRRRVGVYCPPPLHWFARALREFRHRMRTAWRAPDSEGAQFFEMRRRHRERLRLADEYARGYMAGWGECFRACQEAIEDEMARTGGVWSMGATLAGGGKPPRPGN